MGQKQRFCHALPCGQNAFLPVPDMNRTRPCDEYIVERIMDRQSETVCWKGQLRLTGLPSNLCSPLVLQEISVACIQPVKKACALSHTWLQILLSCLVCDCCGRTVRSNAVIEVCVCSAHARQAGMNIRRGAQIQINHAAFCLCDMFDVSLQIDVITIMSSLCGIKLDSSTTDCCAQFMRLPLYPRPASAAFRPV